ncbi:MAG: ECF transporter S component [Clostridiales bacterium]|jgi:riboflavin transporter FmnP|nr:ECF transporter S component [Clostridiales bacterium]
MQTNRKKLLTPRTMVILAMISTIAFILTWLVRFPVVPAVGFLRYDPKDIIIVIGGFLFGPMAAFLVTVVVALIQMFTISATGWIGFIMNVISGTAFAVTASYIYSRNRTLRGAIIGLVAGTIAMTGVMMVWNYLVTPWFMGVSREMVVSLLVPAFMPFNLFNGIVNSSLTLLLYRPMVLGLQKARVLPEPSTPAKTKTFNPALIAVSVFVLLTAGIWSAVITNSANVDAVDGAIVRLTTETVLHHPHDSPNSISTNLNLPAVGRSSTDISWESSAPGIIAANGVVNLPSVPTEVVLTATVSTGWFILSASEVAEFTFLVSPEVSHETATELAAQALTLESILGRNEGADAVTGDLVLPTEGRFGTAITWASSDSGIVGTGGTVYRPSPGNAEITLYATISRGGHSLAGTALTFNLTIVAVD